jgi:deazaflavin-dependent oxidoreductase (nitroreductase family)
MRLAARTPLPAADPCRAVHRLRRYTVLEVVEYRKEGPEAVVISAFGPDADWLHNIGATPGAEVIIGSWRFPAVHRILGPDEAVRVWSAATSNATA